MTGESFLKIIVDKKWAHSLLRGIITTVVAVFAAAVASRQLIPLIDTAPTPESTLPTQDHSQYTVMDNFDAYMGTQSEQILSGITVIPRVYTLSDLDLIAPEPNPACYGTSADPAELQWLLDEAKQRLGVETRLFSTQTRILPGSTVTYYLDDTIFSITWKQIENGGVYTLSEVKITHGSQFRRYLAGGEYGSDEHYVTRDMAELVNAVTASSGDFYSRWDLGVHVYQGTVYNFGTHADSCYINEDGDLLFTRAGELTQPEEVRQFVEENRIRFSLSFGPVMVENGENVTPPTYPFGEVNDTYARAAICQFDKLHYLMVTLNAENGYTTTATTRDFAQQLVAFGVDKAYSLDGGQTGVIVTGDVLINRPVYGRQRPVSDILYFATSLPEEKWNSAADAS